MLKVANQTIFLDHDAQMTDCLTMSSLALKIFMKKYYDHTNKPLPLINNKGIFDNIKSGYHGGLVEVYKPYGENLLYYDVNSLYPYVSLQDMPGLNWFYNEYCVDETSPNIDTLFGWFYCDIITPIEGNYLGLLPVKTPEGLIFPVGE